MKKVIKFIKNNLLGFLIGLLICLNGVIIAENMLSSEQVSYSNSKTSETTVKGNLDELFSAVDINERLGSTDISSIGDGTITGAISTQQTQINKHINDLKGVYMATHDQGESNVTCLKVDADSYYSSVIISGVSSSYLTVLSVVKNADGTYSLHTTPSNASINKSNGEMCVNTGSWYSHSLIISTRPILYTFSM